MRILHVLHSLDQRYGGPLRAVLDLSARSLLLGVEAEVIGFGPQSIPDNPFPPELIHELPTGFPRHYTYCPGLRKWTDVNLARFDGVILHGMWLYPNWAIVKACTRANLPYACFPHGMLDPWALFGQGPFKAAKKTMYWLLRERSIFRNASAVFFTTERERALAQRTFALLPTSFIVVPYGVDSPVGPAPAPARSELEVPPGRKVALFLGRVHPKKNVDFLIRAWAQAQLDPSWLLIVAGSGEPDYLKYLAELAKQSGIQNHVRFAGPVFGMDKSYLLGRASWFLLPSKQENFGIAVLEAVNAGCPVAISDQVYLADSFHDRSEILPVDLDAWVTFLRDRMPNDQHRQTIVGLDRELIVPKFAINAVTRNWVDVITNVFANAAKPRNLENQ